MWMLWLIIVLVVIIVVWGIASRNNEAKVRLKIATFGCNIRVYNLRIGYNDFWVYVDFEDGDKQQFWGNSIGEVQFKISKTCKMIAQDRDGVNFNKYMKDYNYYEVGVEKDEQVLTYSQYVNLTTSEKRSTKNPIAGYYHSEGFEPFYGPLDHPIRKKI